MMFASEVRIEFAECKTLIGAFTLSSTTRRSNARVCADKYVVQCEKRARATKGAVYFWYAAKLAPLATGSCVQPHFPRQTHTTRSHTKLVACVLHMYIWCIDSRFDLCPRMHIIIGLLLRTRGVLLCDSAQSQPGLVAALFINQ